MPLGASGRDETTPTQEAPPSKTQPLRICVFCSTTTGTGEAHLLAARALAQTLATHDAELVYGGGTTGLMGEIAKTLVSIKGPESVHGVIPRGILSLERPEDASKESTARDNSNGLKKRTWKAKLGLMPSASESQKPTTAATESSLLSESVYGRTTVVEDMPARKRLMCQLVNEGGPGSGFVALTGGFGTMDEVIEMVTLRQFGVHGTRVCLFNVEGFWEPIMGWMSTAIEKGFVRPEARDMLGMRETAEECLEWLQWR